MTVKPYDLTTHDGKTVDWLTHAALLECEKRLGYTLTIVQGSYHKGVSASAGTHDGGGVVDLAPYDWERKVQVLRRVGFAAWHRPAIPGLWGEHIHAVLIGNAKLAPTAAAQVTDYQNHRDGLATHGYDDFPNHPDGVVFKWDPAVANPPTAQPAAYRAPKVPMTRGSEANAAIAHVRKIRGGRARMAARAAALKALRSIKAWPKRRPTGKA